MSRVQLLIFLVIFFVVVFLRIFNISHVPPGVNRDEASIGYTAYSLITTGKDEYGIKYPISFQSFGDWKLPSYIYTVTPFVRVFGLSETAVRLPSALFGVGTVILTFFLVKNLFNNINIALITTFLIAVSPWNLHFSRVGSEANTAVFFILVALILLLKSFKSISWLIIPSFIAFASTYYIYAGNYIFTTLFLIGIFVLYRNQILNNRFLKIGIVLFIVLFLFISSQTVFSANAIKLSGISIFSDPSILHEKVELSLSAHNKPPDLITKVLHNKLVFVGERFLHNFLNSYSPEFLFIKGGDNKAHNISNFGNMYLIEAPFLFLGIIWLLVSRKKTETKLILLWLFIAPIAASITKDAPHSARMLSVFPALTIATGLGFYLALKNIFKLNIRKYVISIIILAFVFNIFIYLDRYHIHFPRDEADNWGISYKQLLSVLNEERYRHKKIIFARTEFSHYIFLLFYSKYDPQRYQNTVQRYPPTHDKFLHVKNYSRFEFRDIVWSKDLHLENALLIDFSKDIPPIVGEGKYKTTKILLPNRKEIFSIVETK